MTVPAASPAARADSAVDEAARERREQATSLGAALGAAGLALSSTGSMVVAAVLAGVAARSRWAVAAALLAVAAVGVRFATVSFDDVAGIQSVLGPAGTLGPTTGAASAWCAAGAVLLGVRARPAASRVERAALALAAGALAAAVALGPGPGGELGIRIAGTATGVVLAAAGGALDRWPRATETATAAALLAGVAAVGLAGWPA